MLRRTASAPGRMARSSSPSPEISLTANVNTMLRTFTATAGISPRRSPMLLPKNGVTEHFTWSKHRAKDSPRRRGDNRGLDSGGRSQLPFRSHSLIRSWCLRSSPTKLRWDAAKVRSRICDLHFGTISKGSRFIWKLTRSRPQPHRYHFSRPEPCTPSLPNREPRKAFAGRAGPPRNSASPRNCPASETRMSGRELTARQGVCGHASEVVDS